MMLLAACEHNSEYLLVTEYMKGSLADLLRGWEGGRGGLKFYSDLSCQFWLKHPA